MNDAAYEELGRFLRGERVTATRTLVDAAFRSILQGDDAALAGAMGAIALRIEEHLERANEQQSLLSRLAHCPALDRKDGSERPIEVHISRDLFHEMRLAGLGDGARDGADHPGAVRRIKLARGTIATDDFYAPNEWLSIMLQRAARIAAELTPELAHSLVSLRSNRFSLEVTIGASLTEIEVYMEPLS